MARAEAVMVFEEHRAVSIATVRRAVNKAGFEYSGADIVAHGLLERSEKSGEAGLLLTDSKTDMVVRLTPSDTESVYRNLDDTYRQGNLGDTVQLHGKVLEFEEANRKATTAGADFTLAVTDWSPGKSAKLPSLVPGKKSKTEQSGSASNKGWF